MANVKKLSTATIKGKLSLAALVEFQKAGKPHPVMRAAGIATGFKTGESQHGTFTALSGQFTAWPLGDDGRPTGSGDSSSTLFLPDIAMQPILVALSVPGAQAVQFALDIWANVVPEEKRKPGGSIYEYTYTDVLPPAEDSPMARLMAAISAAEAPKLEAPAPASEPPAEQAPAPAPKGAKGK
jgi:hypothetical protein